MVSTRSTNKQTHLKQLGESQSDSRSAKTKRAPKIGTKQTKNSKFDEERLSSPQSSSTHKRKGPFGVDTDESKKKLEAEGAESKSNKDEGEGDAIMINRAPVLHLWGACVTHFLYPNLTWSTCLSAGSAISTICAVAKGKSIGAIEEPEDTEERREKTEERKAKENELDVLEVMQFKLKQKGGKILFS